MNLFDFLSSSFYILVSVGEMTKHLAHWHPWLQKIAVFLAFYKGKEFDRVSNTKTIDCLLNSPGSGKRSG